MEAFLGMRIGRKLAIHISDFQEVGNLPINLIQVNGWLNACITVILLQLKPSTLSRPVAPSRKIFRHQRLHYTLSHRKIMQPSQEFWQNQFSFSTSKESS